MSIAIEVSVPVEVVSAAAAPQSRRRPVLSLVPAAGPGAGRAPFVAFVAVLLAAGLLGLLVLNTVLAKDAFSLHNLKVEGQVLEDREQAMQRQVEELRSSQVLEAKARELNMVRSVGPPAFLRLPDGVVLGSPTAAEAPAPAEGAPVPPAPGTDPDVPADAAAGPAEASATEPAAADENADPEAGQ